MPTSYLKQYIEVLCKKSIHDDSALSELNIHNEEDYDRFTDGVFAEVDKLSIGELQEVIKSILGEHKTMDSYIFDVVYTIIDMHFENHPKLHPDKGISSLLKKIGTMPTLQGSSVSQDIMIYMRQYDNYEDYRHLVGQQ